MRRKVSVTMPVKDLTKQLIVDTFRELVRVRRLKDIRVIEICERCGISRRTFYYHFQDKYDLLAWVMEQEFVSKGPASALINLESRKQAYETIRERRQFYKSVYSDPGISELSEYLANYDMKYYTDYAESILGKGALTEAQVFSLGVFVYGGIYMSRKWVLDGCKIEPGVIAQHMDDCMPRWLAQLVSAEEQADPAGSQ